MKLDWTKDGWRVFNDEPDAVGILTVLDFDRIVLTAPVELIRDPGTKHGWVLLPGTTLSELKAMTGETDDGA